MGRRPDFPRALRDCAGPTGAGVDQAILLFSVTQVHAGVLSALFAFMLWMLPGACAMYGLSLAVQRIGTPLPSPVYALLSGLNAATVGGIALSAVRLARKAITDHLTHALVLLAACAGLCYNTLWYYLVLIFLGGLSTLLWDSRGPLFALFGYRSTSSELGVPTVSNNTQRKY
ncbi:hypothetical protein AX15_002317 [Amanita polypyramis BW_CC]|nr:hypothetical protein AX15_002317 [Amanita polypyramis BW_CC]